MFLFTNYYATLFRIEKTMCFFKVRKNKTEDPSVPYAGKGYVTQRIDQVTIRYSADPTKRNPKDT